MRNKAIIGLSAAAMAAGLGLGAGTLASAEDEATPTPSATATEDGTTPSTGSDAPRDDRGRGPGHGQGRGAGGWMGVDLESMAEKLGVEEEALSEAVQAARESFASEGRPDDPTGQTDEDREAARAAHQAEFAAGIAAELGLDEDDVTAALEEIADERDAARAEKEQAVLDEAVSDGTLTQAEADAVAKAVAEGIVQVRGGHGH